MANIFHQLIIETLLQIYCNKKPAKLLGLSDYLSISHAFKALTFGNQEKESSLGKSVVNSQRIRMG